MRRSFRALADQTRASPGDPRPPNLQSLRARSSASLDPEVNCPLRAPLLCWPSVPLTPSISAEYCRGEDSWWMPALSRNRGGNAAIVGCPNRPSSGGDLRARPLSQCTARLDGGLQAHWVDVFQVDIPASRTQKPRPFPIPIVMPHDAASHPRSPMEFNILSSSSSSIAEWQSESTIGDAFGTSGGDRRAHVEVTRRARTLVLVRSRVRWRMTTIDDDEFGLHSMGASSAPPCARGQLSDRF